MRQILALPLTARAFEPFGTVTQIPPSAGLIGVETAHDATPDAQKPVFQLVRAMTAQRPVIVRQLEKHPFSAQTFVALGGASSLIIVCGAGPSGPDLEKVWAFVCAPDQVVTYHKAVWHHKLTPLGDNATFSMTMMHTGIGGDTVLNDLSEPFEIVLPGN